MLELQYTLNFTHKGGLIREIFGHHLIPLCQICPVLAEERPYEVGPELCYPLSDLRQRYTREESKNRVSRG